MSGVGLSGRQAIGKLEQIEAARELRAAAMKRHDDAVGEAHKTFAAAKDAIQYDHDLVYNQARDALAAARHTRDPDQIAAAEIFVKAAAARPAPSFEAATAEKDAAVAASSNALRSALEIIRAKLDAGQITSEG